MKLFFFFFFTVQVINYTNIAAYLYSFRSLYAKCSWIIKEFITGRVLDISLMYLQLPGHLSFTKHWEPRVGPGVGVGGRGAGGTPLCDRVRFLAFIP